ncbi:MAG: thiamine-monophosphate kinase, partial [Sphingomonadaceae bacterium]|nr:thiamine-monophosphate kinase [Sphingomonadaceae bacterium]
AIGTSGHAPSRSGARPGDTLWLGGSVGDAGIGLAIARGERDGPASLLAAYRRPVPQLELGRRIAPYVHAMMDVSDGLLIDAARLAAASRVRVTIDLARIPLSEAFRSLAGDTREARLAAASAGDDYVLLAAGPANLGETVEGLAAVGAIEAGEGLKLIDAGHPVPLPDSLGYEHRTA